MLKRKTTGKSEVHLKRTTHKLQPNEEHRIIIGKVAIGIRIVSAKPRLFTTPHLLTSK
jgi:hypothetical protein